MMIIDDRIYNKPVEPVSETTPTKLESSKLPDVNFEEMLQRLMYQDRMAEKRAEERENQAAAQQPNPAENDQAVNQVGMVNMSYSLLDRMLLSQKMREEKEQVEKNINTNINPDQEYTR